MESDFRIKEINAKGRVTFQNEENERNKNLLRQQERRLNVKCETETLFVVLSLNVKRRHLGTSSSSQFQYFWRISTLVKYSSFLGAKNVRRVSRIWGQEHGN